jgi:glycosyltransferase involved in cell wall biosynthesis
MTKSAAISEDGASLKKMCEAGFEVVVVMDGDLEETLRIVEAVRQNKRKGMPNDKN